MKRDPYILCLVGASGSGKSTVGKRLLEQRKGLLRRSISVTSRNPREGEISGESYYFVSPEEFEEKIRRNEFFEWENIHGNFYGTPNSIFENQSSDLLMIIDICGALNVQKQYPEKTIIVFLTPSSPEELADRIRGRMGAHFIEEELRKRLQTAREEYRIVREEINNGGNVDYIVINDQVDDAVQRLEVILSSTSEEKKSLKAENFTSEQITKIFDFS